MRIRALYSAMVNWGGGGMYMEAVDLNNPKGNAYVVTKGPPKPIENKVFEAAHTPKGV